MTIFIINTAAIAVDCGHHIYSNGNLIHRTIEVINKFRFIQLLNYSYLVS